MLTERQQKILKILHGQEKYITIRQIAEQIHFSPKTVRNDLLQVRTFLQQNQLGELTAKPKKGFRLLMTAEEWDKLQSLLRFSARDIPKEKRKYAVCALLLQDRAVGMAELEKKLYLSRSGAEKALEEARQWLEERGICLQKKRGRGFLTECSELVRRMTEAELFVLYRSESGIGTDQGFLTDVSRFLNGFDASGVLSSTANTEEEYGFHFAYNARQTLLFLISFALFRCRAKAPLAECPLKNRPAFSQRVTAALVQQLEHSYSVRIPPAEREYLLFCVSACEIQEFEDTKALQMCEQEEPQTLATVQRFVRLTSDLLGLDLRADSALEKDLFLYLRSAVEKLRYGIYIPNPLLAQVKGEYPNVYAVVWTTSVLFGDSLQVELTENEVGYLTVYVVGAVERASAQVKICILCSYGVGVSQLLKQQIERLLPNISVIRIATVQEPDCVRRSGCDFVITAENIGDTFGGKDVVVVDNFLIPYDIRKIQKKMFEVLQRKMEHITKNTDLQQIRLFDSRFVYFCDHAEKTALLQTMCGDLEEKGYVLPGFNESVLQREKAASTQVGRRIAIPHGSTRYVVRPIIAVAVLKNSIPWDRQDTADFVFLLAIQPDSLLHMKPQMMKFYKVLSALIDDEKTLNEVKKMTDRQEFADYMNHLTQ
ncbi:hypothetical protein B6259_00845 [Ruminococcaceae bacterium CPB6]|nr:hypothetical protein B6259_00845 [Ruminococcaceae bacterium CPB6]